MLSDQCPSKKKKNITAKKIDNEGKLELNLSKAKAKHKHQPHPFLFVCLSL